MLPIKIDLRDLTDARVEEALPHIGAYFYSSPRIIGTLIPVDQRARFDNCNDELRESMGAQPSIEHVIDGGFIEFPSTRQAELARKLQKAFDNDGRRRFLTVLADVRKELAA